MLSNCSVRVSSGWRRPAALAVLLGLGLFAMGCEKTTGVTSGTALGPQPTVAIDPQGGTAVVILVDTSGSMKDPPGSGGPPKFQTANEALDRIVARTADWKQGHADKRLQLALYHFASGSHVVLPMGEFDATKAKDAVRRIPHPVGGTAIGTALKDAYAALSRTGAPRQFILCITDGQNTDPPEPAPIAEQIHRESGGRVEIHFIAFDTKGTNYVFLEKVNGHVVEAVDAKQLQEELDKIYEKRILVE
jgi:uncharacterized protein YegL